MWSRMKEWLLGNEEYDCHMKEGPLGGEGRSCRIKEVTWHMKEMTLGCKRKLPHERSKESGHTWKKDFSEMKVAWHWDGEWSILATTHVRSHYVCVDFRGRITLNINHLLSYQIEHSSFNKFQIE